MEAARKIQVLKMDKYEPVGIIATISFLDGGLPKIGDIKPGTPSGARTFRSDVNKGKLPTNTQRLDYDNVTGRLK